jgi:hypothetical protein
MTAISGPTKPSLLRGISPDTQASVNDLVEVRGGVYSANKLICHVPPKRSGAIVTRADANAMMRIR